MHLVSPALEESFTQRIPYEPLTGFGRFALMMCIPLTLVILAGGILPATHFDVREYHLAEDRLGV